MLLGRAFVCAYLGEHHGRDLLGGESLGLAEVLNLNHGVGALLDDLEGPRLDILLDDRVIEGTTDQTPVRGVLSANHCNVVCRGKNV